ncbi:rubrerythrin family protein, partial [Klebsiella pneumoniae]
LAALVGDRTILKAMSTNEIETNMAYDHASQNTAASPESHAFFRKALADETRHKDWMDAAAAS